MLAKAVVISAEKPTRSGSTSFIFSITRERIDVHSEIVHLEALGLEQRHEDVLPQVVDIPLRRGQHHPAQWLGRAGAIELWLQDRHHPLEDLRSQHHLGEEQRPFLELVADGGHGPACVFQDLERIVTALDPGFHRGENLIPLELDEASRQIFQHIHSVL